MEPVGTGNHGAAEGNEQDQQDEAAATSRAGKASPKAKAILEEVEDEIQES